MIFYRTQSIYEGRTLFTMFIFQGLASVFNISLGIVSWWTSKESDRYNRLIQLRVFAFCVNILHAYITGPIIYQNDDSPLLAPGTFTGIDVVLSTCISTGIDVLLSSCMSTSLSVLQISVNQGRYESRQRDEIYCSNI